MEKNKYEKFEIVTINRSEIHGAPYNPRRMSEANRKRLRENIKRVGMVEPIVVNKPTRNIVSGHQRISILDTLMHKKDYEITVAMVDLSEKEEMEQNLFMNNSKAMGEYDEFQLAEIFESYDIELDNTGFELPDLGLMGIEIDMTLDDDEIPEQISEDDKEMLQLNGKIFTDSHELRKAIKEYGNNGNREVIDLNVVLTFGTTEAKVSFMQRYGFEGGEKYIKGEVFDKIIEQRTSDGKQ